MVTSNKTFGHALRCLSHPVSIGALLLLLLNDHLLRHLWPSWWTGKLGDAAWLIFAPFMLLAFFAVILPERVSQKDDALFWASVATTGGVFAAANTIPAFQNCFLNVLEAVLGWRMRLVVDPTDLLTLPVLLIPVMLWYREQFHPVNFRFRHWVLLGMSALASIATSGPPYIWGVTCLGVLPDDTVAAVSDSNTYYGALSGGMHWERVDGSIDDLEFQDGPCIWPKVIDEKIWVYQHPFEPETKYRMTRGQLIERSVDDGQTWHEEFRLIYSQAQEMLYLNHYDRYKMSTGPFDATVDPKTGNMIVAMGLEGVLVRSPDGIWQWRSVGEFQRVPIDKPAHTLELLSSELWLGITLMFFLPGVIASLKLGLQGSKVFSVAGFLIFSIAVWVLSDVYVLGKRAVLFWPVSPRMLLLPVTLVALVAFAAAIQQVGWTESAKLFGYSSIVFLCYFSPYFLWRLNVITQYNTARIIAGILLASSIAMILQDHVRAKIRGETESR
jgi:hypothetical protein